MRTAIFSDLLGSFALLQACSGESGRPVDASPPPSADTSGPPSATTIRAKIAAGLHVPSCSKPAMPLIRTRPTFRRST